MALKLIRKFAVASLLTLLSSATVSAQTLVFTAIPDEDETKLVERFTGIADYLAGELDVDVRYIPVKSYAAAVSAFRNNQVQLAWFGGLSGVQARGWFPALKRLPRAWKTKRFTLISLPTKVPDLTRWKPCPTNSGEDLYLRFQGVNLRSPDSGVLYSRIL